MGKCPVSLQKTDITQPALEALAESQVRRVLIFGRRGPIQVACTIKVRVGRARLERRTKAVTDILKRKKNQL